MYTGTPITVYIETDIYTREQHKGVLTFNHVVDCINFWYHLVIHVFLIFPCKRKAFSVGLGQVRQTPLIVSVRTSATCHRRLPDCFLSCDRHWKKPGRRWSRRCLGSSLSALKATSPRPERDTENGFITLVNIGLSCD